MKRSTALLAVGGIGVFVAAALVAAVASDVVVDDTVFVVADPFAEYPVVAIGASVVAADDGTDGESDDGDADPGAVVGPVLVPAPPPLLPDAPPDPAIAAADQAPLPTTTSDTSDAPTSPPGSDAPPPAAPTATGATTTTSTIATTPVPGAPGGGSGDAAPGWGTTDVPPGDGSPTLHAVFRFRDRCADAATVACPPGLGATVLFSGGGDAPPPPVQIDLLVDPPVAIRDQVRCELGWPTSTSIPVLITSNRPLDTVHSRLGLTDGRLVDEANNERSAPSEIAWYEQRVQTGQVVGTAVGDGVHTCVDFELDGPGAPAGLDRNGRFEVQTRAFAGSSSATRTVVVDGDFRTGRPPVRIVPLDGYRATMIVPQRANDVVTATLYRDGQPGVGDHGACPAADMSNDEGTLTRRSPAQGPAAYSAAELQAPAYPYDRAYTHYTVWDLYLLSGTGYQVCVDGQIDDMSEHLLVETPYALHLSLLGGELRYNSNVAAGSLSLHVLGVNGCWVANPGQGSVDGRDPFPELLLSHSSGWESWRLPDPNLCNSGGWRLPSIVEIRSGLSAPGDDTVYGIAQLPMDVLARDCRDEECTGPTVEWRNQNVLCGGPWGSGDCQGDLFRALTTRVRMIGDPAKVGADPMAWNITRMVRLGE